jgi:hypothetical protein
MFDSEQKETSGRDLVQKMTGKEGGLTFLFTGAGAHMKLGAQTLQEYRIVELAPIDPVNSDLKVLQFENDQAVIAAAKSRLRGHAIEVWHDDRRLAHLEPEATALRSGNSAK